MKNTTIIYLMLGLIMLGSPSLAQQLEIYSDDEYIYKSEAVGGFNFNTNGGFLGGGMFRYSWASKPTVYRNVSLEIVNIKHSKETRRQSPATGSIYVIGKVNNFFMLRPQYGLERVLFRKAKDQGVQVNLIAAAGPAIGVVAPYLIVYDGVEEQYNPRVHTNQLLILKTGSLLNSLSQADIKVGASLKASLTFEFGTFKSSVSGFELGFMTDIYGNEITILSDARDAVQNQSVFTSAFVNIYFGSRK